MTDALAPTDEQAHIFRLAAADAENVMIDALAGTGKTTTIEQVEQVIKRKPLLYLVFNKKNQLEAEKKMSSLTKVKTLNGLGHMVWSSGRRIKLNAKKTQDHLREIIDGVKATSERNVLWEIFWPTCSAVGLAKNLGYVPDGRYSTANCLIHREAFHAFLDEPPDDLMADLIDSLLVRSIKEALDGHIDFDDQVYMPTCFGGAFPKFPVLAVDEYQDLNPCNHIMIEKLVGKTSRLFGVGDPWQNIYGFRGAKQGGMASATERFGMTTADLSISFRCPSEIVNHVKWHVPKFKAFKSGGSVTHPELVHGPDIADDATFICRNNAPLFSMALRLLASGRSVSVAGSDVGPRIVAMMKKLGGEDDSQDLVLNAIEEWRAAKLEAESKTANDIADCMKVFASHGSTLGMAIAYAEHLFRQEGSLRFYTGHKAKGLEFNTVYHLDPWLCKDTQQDRNLYYVISTRSRDRLIEIDSDRIRL